jgi:two-component system, OmpR family, KDP operon response regulator KdpE
MEAKQRKILVVDDDPDISRIVIHALNNAGYRAIPAYGVDDALRKVERDEFDLVLTDLAMPKLSGVHLIDSLRTHPRTAGIPIVAMTAFTRDTLGRTAGEVGCDGYLTKPFRTAQLLETVAKHLQ